MGGGRERSWPGQEVKRLSLTSTPVFWQTPRPRCFRRRRIEDKTHQIPGNRLTALNARLAAETRVRDQVQSERGPSRQVPGHTDTHEAGQTDGQRQRRARARLTAGRRVRRVSGRQRAGSTSQARSGGRRPGRGEGSPGAPSPRTRRAGPAPPSPAVCGSVRRSPGLPVSRLSRAAPRGLPNFSALPCAAPSAPPRLQHRRAPGPGLRAQGSGDPWRWRPPRPRLGRLPFAAPTVLSLSPPRSRPPCAPIPAPRRWPPAPRPPRPADPGSAATSPPRAGLCPSRSLPPPGSLSPRVPVSVSVALPVCSLPSSTPARSLPCVSLSLCLARGLCLCVSLPPTLAAAPRALGPRPPSPAPRPRPARPGARAPAARGAPRTPNSRHPLRFARLSPLLTRDPRPTAEAAPPTLPAPEPRAARGARPCPFPLRLTGHHTPVPTARGPGPSPGWGPRGPLLPEILPGFSSSLQERSSRSPFRESASGFFRPPHPSMGRWRGFLRAVKGLWVGEGRYPARWPRAAPLCGPLTLLKDEQLRTLHTPLPSTEVWLCWNDPHNQLGSTAPFYRQGD